MLIQIHTREITRLQFSNASTSNITHAICGGRIRYVTIPATHGSSVQIIFFSPVFPKAVISSGFPGAESFDYQRTRDEEYHHQGCTECKLPRELPIRPVSWDVSFLFHCGGCNGCGCGRICTDAVGVSGGVIVEWYTHVRLPCRGRTIRCGFGCTGW